MAGSCREVLGAAEASARQPGLETHAVTGADGSQLRLREIKLAHTVIWAIMVGCILALPLAGVERWFRVAAWLSAIVFAECGVLAVNRGRCPLTDMAAAYTTERADNFDIYLPLWVARYNKRIFGALFVVGEIVVLGCWVS